MNLETEKELFKKGYKLIAGIDEAGRGPLAGPVVSACVVIDENFKISPELMKVKDSKKLDAKKREHLFPVIKEAVRSVEIGICDNQTIDKINILQATFLSMKKSLEKNKISPDIILVDGNFKIPKIKTSQIAIKSGDENVFVIAMASIIAKVSRDFIMNELHKEYPDYLFSKHKGYGTKDHLKVIRDHGPSPIHRMSFAPLSNKIKRQ
jgi:ribonuclease HII